MERGAVRSAFVVAVVLVGIVCGDGVWDPATAVLVQGISDAVYPGCTAMVADKSGTIYSVALGNFTYGIPPPQNPGENPAVTLETVYDLASLTKVTAATTAIAHFYQRDGISLDTQVSSLLPGYEVNGKGPITLLNLLLHNAGLAPDPSPGYWESSFACPQTPYYNPGEDFSCMSKIYHSVLQESIVNPVGAVYDYSDLSMITMMYCIGRLAKDLGYISTSDILSGCPIGQDGDLQCYYEAYIRKYVLGSAFPSMTYLPSTAIWSQCAPTENDTVYRHTVSQGQVHDKNAYAMGGVSGHAGFFSNIKDVLKLTQMWLFATDDDPLLNQTTSDFWTTEYNHAQSSRAIGWNTNDYTVFDQGWTQSCGTLSEHTFMHTGYTGTMICADKDRQLIVLLMTNRVYPVAGSSTPMHDVRQKFTTQVQKIYDSTLSRPPTNVASRPQI
ncbi:penicillin-binding protein 4* [Pelomyxa schiedti]|nr:penicillin-binding protein 4* [Pelomyxa schiedti]